jgi:hypothetical protein
MERIRASNVWAEKCHPSGAWIVSALWRGYRQARRYEGYTKREAIRLYCEEMNAQPEVKP